jgi:hypothetical protein
MTRPSILPLALLAPLALAACGPKADTTQAAASNEPVAASTDWTMQNPTDPAVPVELPKTAMTNAPVDAASPAPTPSGK